MTIQLKPEQEKFLKAQVASGKYNSSQEVVDKMFLVFEKIQNDYEQWLEETQIKISEGIESLESGKGIDGEIVINRLRQRLHEGKIN
jgi:antitoxin ParD1/3/4